LEIEGRLEILAALAALLDNTAFFRLEPSKGRFVERWILQPRAVLFYKKNPDAAWDTALPSD
jgi:hypothetical protein